MARIPYKINLSEDEMPKYWQNVRPYMKEVPDPFINPATGKPCSADDLLPFSAMRLSSRSWTTPTNRRDPGRDPRLL